MAATAIETAETKIREGADAAISTTGETMSQAGSQARSTLRDQADQRSSQAGERIKNFVGDIHTTADELRKQGKDQPADAIEQVASRADKLGNYLEEADGERILNDVESFGRERPWAIAAAGFAIGLMASRFLKASSVDRYDRSMGNQQREPLQQNGNSPTHTPGRQFDPNSTPPGLNEQQNLAAGGPPMPGGGT